MRNLRAVLRHTKGAALPMLAAGLLPAIAALGSAIDMGRIYVAKSALQAGVDAAALAGARSYAVTGNVPNSREAQVDAYFYGNFPKETMGSSGLVLTPTFQTVNKRNQTSVTASVNIPMTFMRTFGIEQQKISAIATAEIQPHPLEIMMVLDNTGSLKADLPASNGSPSKTRITALKDASKSFLDILYQGADNRDDLAMGFVMYDITANVGKLLPSSMVRQRFGFNDALATQFGGGWPAQPLLWKGCVFDDATVQNMTSDISYRDPGAWDIDRSLPGEGAHPPIEPYFIPPFWTPREKAAPDKPGKGKGRPGNASAADPNGEYYKYAGGEADFNLYKLHPQFADAMLNYDKSDANPYRPWFYTYYLGLNNGAATSGDDVITRVGGGYYDPDTMDWDFASNTGTPFEIHYDRIPRFQADWKDARDSRVNPQGGSTNNGGANRTEAPSPNWQCPEEAEPVTYGRSKAYWTDVIEKKNAAIYPANGTLHHAGLLWGYRLLVRDDVFKRSNPVNEDAKRALVFMTDGETALSTAPNGYANRTWTFYGNYGDAPISKNVGDLTRQSELRFSKTCASMQAEKNPPKVYIVALTTTDKKTLDMFEQCAPGHVYRTSDAATLKAAFDDIASELVDLHLVK
ncbi:Putative Flp pilus-assembly TadE/G-like [Sphingomonas palmae]|uniref:Putative Flp pilus-assembly TadE/G-like n=1 Tax=Sphingomonas palmae TaxID=1855283 RepID=A0A1H7SYW0_9SPHN|nr:TadE/TadG family type IV pilus assembly protein [Sphingomonas palmae]SEL77429.1 Putative Flp pilus-assembly TadE/G-like [Sphingomonas palmae]